VIDLQGHFHYTHQRKSEFLSHHKQKSGHPAKTGDYDCTQGSLRQALTLIQVMKRGYFKAVRLKMPGYIGVSLLWNT
jgi:hypothetical protein